MLYLCYQEYSDTILGKFMFAFIKLLFKSKKRQMKTKKLLKILQKKNLQKKRFSFGKMIIHLRSRFFGKIKAV